MILKTIEDLKNTATELLAMQDGTPFRQDFVRNKLTPIRMELCAILEGVPYSEEDIAECQDMIAKIQGQISFVLNTGYDNTLVELNQLMQ